MAEQVDTGAVYHLAGDSSTDNAEYTLTEGVTANGTKRGAQVFWKETGYENEYQLADPKAEDNANIESIHR